MGVIFFIRKDGLRTSLEINYPNNFITPYNNLVIFWNLVVYFQGSPLHHGRNPDEIGYERAFLTFVTFLYCTRRS